MLAIKTWCGLVIALSVGWGSLGNRLAASEQGLGCDASTCDAQCSDWGCKKKCGLDGLFDWVKPSDHCFDDFISPMSNFIFFEDPRTLTEARFVFLQHRLPNPVGPLALPGGEVQLYALQFRMAITERLSLIAVKDGFIVTHIHGGPLDALLDDGWAAVTAGLKYNLVRDTCHGTLLSAGFTYELPIGSQRTLQDVGDGELHLFLTGGQRLWGGDGHYLGSFGVRLPVDDDVQTTSIHWSHHLDVKLTDKLYAFTEFAWWHWTKSASTGLPLGVAGHDAFNLSATNVSGNDLLTQSVGVKYKPSGHTEIGVAYEFPLTGFEDILDDRIQVECIWRY